MFFPHLIKSIKESDRVLEIGPGGSPHPRADVFLEHRFDTEEEEASQRGHAAKPRLEKPVVYYSGDQFPFKDNEFDYVICSHVLEHVPNPAKFISELTRVGKKGYLEFPLAYYDFIYDIPDHITFAYFTGSEINWMPKKEFSLAPYKALQSHLKRSMEFEYFSFIDQMKPIFFQGFEWFDAIKTKQVHSIEEVIWPKIEKVLLPFKDCEWSTEFKIVSASAPIPVAVQNHQQPSIAYRAARKIYRKYFKKWWTELN